MSDKQKLAIVSVYDKTGLLDLAKGLVQQNVRILASGGTSRMIRESGFPVEYAQPFQEDRNLRMQRWINTQGMLIEFV